MKRIVLFLTAALALYACSKEMPVPTETETPKMVFNISVNRLDGQATSTLQASEATKAVKSSWEQGDVVFVFFSTVPSPKFLKLSFDGVVWTSETYNGSSTEDFSITEDGVMSAIYLPYGNDEVVSADGTSFKFAHTYTSYYLFSEKTPYTVSGNTINGVLDMTTPEGFVQFSMPNYGTDVPSEGYFLEVANRLTLSESHIKPLSFSSVSKDGTVSNIIGNNGDPITAYYYIADASTYRYEHYINFSGILDASVKDVSTDYTFSLVNNRNTAEEYDDATYLLSGTKTMTYGSAFRFPLVSSSSWKVPEPQWVEINGVKWGKWNVGASSIGGYGDYYSWGDSYPKAHYGQSDGYYKNNYLSVNLSGDKDVATMKLGEGWHIPSEADFNSIYDTVNDTVRDGVTWNWISIEQLEVYGVNGFEIYPTGHPEQKIFIPISGYCDGDNYYRGVTGANTKLWTSTLGGQKALCVGGSHSGNHWWSNFLRHIGGTIRPVHD